MARSDPTSAGLVLAAVVVQWPETGLARRRASQPNTLPAVLRVICRVAASILVCGALAGGAAPLASAFSGSVYFTAGEQFAPVKRTLPDSGRRLPTALRLLLAGPTAAEQRRGFGSAIPQGSKVLAESFDAATGVATIRFDARFIFTRRAVRTKADAIREYYGRAGEVVFTATSLPEVKAVRLSAPGKDAVTLRRADFAKPAREPAAQKPPTPTGPKPSDTRAIQQALARLTYLPAGAVNGTYDDRTRQAIRAFQGVQGLDRDGLAGPKTTAALATAAVLRPRESGSGRRVEIDRARGVVLLVSGGRVQRVIHTSTGRGGDSTDVGTPTGRFKIYRKERESWSVPYRVWLPYAAYWDRGWALHGYKDVPNYPASAGCARLPLSEAPIVYAFVKIGTPVTVY